MDDAVLLQAAASEGKNLDNMVWWAAAIYGGANVWEQIQLDDAGVIEDGHFDELLRRTRQMLRETEDMSRDLQSYKRRVCDSTHEMQSLEDRIECMRREQNKLAAIIWNFPDDLHPMLVASAAPEQKLKYVREFLERTIGVPHDDLQFIGIDHVRIFYTTYKSQRSANVRIQFTDEDAKRLCETYCIKFFKTFNQMRQSPTRWKDDQTEAQREEAAATMQARPNTGQLTWTKVIRWPPQA